MGEVYSARHETIDQRVAVKVLNPELARNPVIRLLFIQEANIQVSLRHPGIVQVLTATTTGPHLALVMEFVDGLALDKVVDCRGPLPLEDAFLVFSQVLDAVGHAHSQGIVHRDLKPSNVMVQANGTTKVRLLARLLNR